MTWIEELLDVTNEIETPRSYIRWAAYASISAIVKKNVWFNKGNAYRIYPNTYIMLVGPPGITKSYATDIAKKMVKFVNNTRIISGQNSIEGIIERLAKVKLVDGIPDKSAGAQAFIVSSEFTTLLLNNPDALSTLTDLYDSLYHEEWTKTLKAGEVTLRDPYITMMSATNIAHFNDKIRQVDVEGGFMGRTMVVVEKDLHRINPLIRPMKKSFILADATKRLTEIAKLRGEFLWDCDETITFYENWYTEFKTSLQHDETGIFKRMPDNVIKVAMLASLAEKDELIFTRKIIEESIDTCLKLTTSVKSITAGSGTSVDSVKYHRLIQCLLNSEDYRLGHTEILRRNFQHFDTFDLGKMVETMTQAGALKTEFAGNKKTYVLTDLALAEWMKAKEKV